MEPSSQDMVISVASVMIEKYSLSTFYMKFLREPISENTSTTELRSSQHKKKAETINRHARDCGTQRVSHDRNRTFFSNNIKL